MSEVNAQIIVDVPSSDELPGGFRDAIYVPMSEYEQMSAEQVEALRQERIDAHLARLEEASNTPPVEAPAVAVSSVEQARQILADALAHLAALPEDSSAVEG